MEYKLMPYPASQDVVFHYINNPRNTFYEALEKCFKVTSDLFSLDGVRPNKGWETLYPRIARNSVPAANHMTLPNKEKLMKGIVEICCHIYQRSERTETQEVAKKAMA